MATDGQTLLDRLQPACIGGWVVLGIFLGPVQLPRSGAAMTILALAYGSRQAIVARRKWMARASRIGMPLMGAAFVGVGAFVLTGLDNIVEASLTRAMPNRLVAVTTRFWCRDVFQQAKEK